MAVDAVASVVTVDVVASLVLEKLRDLQLEESFMKNKVIEGQLQEIQKALEKMSGFFIDAANKETDVENIKKWTNDYLQYLYSVENSIELFALRIKRQRKRLGFLMNHALFLKKFTACKMLIKLHRVQTKIKRLNSRTPTVLEDASLRMRSPRQAASNPSASIRQGSPRSLRDNASVMRERWQQSKLTYNDEEELSSIAYKRKVSELQKRLDNSNDWIIPLLGERGSGKTTLARAVYGNRIIKDRFESSCAWATIFKESTTTDILLNLMKQVKKSNEEQDGDRDSVKNKFLQVLKDRRYLIVLDGVQNLDQWSSLKDAFPNQQNKSKIILTTCNVEVVQHADPEAQPYNMETLDSNENWTLFLRTVGLEKNTEDSLKERIFQVCRGLPLNIVLLGSLLSTKENKEEWTDILYSHENWKTSDIITLSYNDLDAHLKLCLIYMTLFPRELDIPVRRLQRLWLAEGFVERPQNQSEFQEDVAQKYFEDLVKRSLITISKLRSDGSPRKCRLLGVLHDYLSPTAQDISLFHVHGGSNSHEVGPFGKRRLIEYADGKNCSLQSSEYQSLRSYISFNFQKKDTPAKYVGTLVSNMIGKGFVLLRVLDLEGVYKPSLPENLGDLFHLRYLGLRWTFLDKLPKSVGELPYLETLDLKHTYINKIPPSIWKLKHLRHLNLSEVHLDKDTPLHLRNSLPKLLTLWGLSVNHDSPVKNGLSKLTHLRELGISFRLIKYDDDTTERIRSLSPTESPKDLLDWISKLTALQSLRLRSRDDSGCPADLILKSFSDLKNLSHMNLYGKLHELPHENHFPPYIKVLTLSVSHLEQDPMPMLGQLPKLMVLRLLADSYLGEKMVCPCGTFENLEVLKLWMLKDLKKWEVEEGAMKKLKELNIRCCSKLENIPHALLQQESFKDLILNNMPDGFEENVNKINNQCKVTVKNYQL